MEFCSAEDITNALPLGQQDIDSSLGALNLKDLISDTSNYITSKLYSRYAELVEGDGVLKQICIGLVFQKVIQFLNSEQLDGLKQSNIVSIIQDAKKDLQALIDGSLTLPTTSKTSTVRLNSGFPVLTDEQLAAKRML
jgi:hypothetical protein